MKHERTLQQRTPKRIRGSGGKAWWYEEDTGILVVHEPEVTTQQLSIPWHLILLAAQRSSGREVIVRKMKR